jgi:o-succinylbenzoate synthase
VSGVRTRGFALSLATALDTATGSITERRGLLVRVAGDPPGTGEATPLPGWTESLADCRAALADPPADPATPPPMPDHPAARHGLVTAGLDAAARRAGASLAARLADGDPADRVPVNATLGDADPATTAARARAAVADGFEHLKLKAGAGPLARDRERVRAVRDAVGPDPTLRLDANGAWDRPTARRAVETLAGLGVAYVEQPLPAADLAGHRALRGRDGAVAVALDESVVERGIERVLAAGAADVVVCKPMALGGPDRAVAAAARARAAGVDAVVTTTVDAAVARTAAVHAAAAIPGVRACGLATADLLAEDVTADPAPVADGSVAVPAGPGLAGAAFDGLVE